MEQNQDFSALRHLLASTRLEMPADTQVDQFLIEFHRRQRAQLLVPQPVLARVSGWMKERLAGFQLVPSLSCASAFAAITLVACLGLSRQVQVTQVDGQSKLTFRMAANENTFALVSGSMISDANAFSKLNDSPAFIPARADSVATSYVLATNSHGASDATVAF